MIYEVIYNQKENNNFEYYVKNVFNINYKKDCFIYFHYGENASKFFNKSFPNYLDSYQYIKDLEKKFNVNINWYDLSYIFDNLPEDISNEDVERILYYIKIAYRNKIEKIISKIEK